MEYSKKFLKDRSHLIERYSDWGSIENNGNVIYLKYPELISAFSGYLKYQNRNSQGKIYFRGERHFYSTTIPTLFRFNDPSDFNDDNIQIRKNAFSELITELPKIYKSSRFKNENSGRLLQHYGINTPWIDLVDNLFVAIWFSNYRCSNNQDFTYIKFFSSYVNNNQLAITDLREAHSSLSLRPHNQHGILASKDIERWNKSNCDFNSNLLAVAKIPNNSLFRIHSYIFSEKFMFPNDTFDNTYKLLKKDKFESLLKKITDKYRIDPKDLGLNGILEFERKKLHE